MKQKFRICSMLKHGKPVSLLPSIVHRPAALTSPMNLLETKNLKPAPDLLHQSMYSSMFTSQKSIYHRILEPWKRSRKKGSSNKVFQGSLEELSRLGLFFLLLPQQEGRAWKSLTRANPSLGPLLKRFSSLTL